MKNWMRKAIALLLAMMLVTGAVAFAEKETVSGAFRLPAVSEKVEEEPTDEPVGEETPAEGEEPAADEAAGEEPPVEGEEPAEGEEVAEEEPVVEEEQTEVESETPAVIGKATVTLSDSAARLNVRAEAGKSADVLGSLDNGTVVSVLAHEGEWLKIVYGEGAGYIKASLTTSGVVEEEPVEEEPVEEPAPEIDYSALKVEIDSTLDDVVVEGDTIVLTSKLTGFEGLTYSMQWQCNDGSGWADVPGATGESYSFTADADNVNYQWRLSVTL